MACDRPSKFGKHGQCGNGDIMFLVLKEQDFTCSRLNSILLLISV